MATARFEVICLWKDGTTMPPIDLREFVLHYVVGTAALGATVLVVVVLVVGGSAGSMDNADAERRAPARLEKSPAPVGAVPTAREILGPTFTVPLAEQPAAKIQ
jgi:hypothetical protein